MAVTTHIYPSALAGVLGGGMALVSNSSFVALLDDSAVYDGSDEVFSDISSNEIPSADGYTAGGAMVASPVVSVTDGVAYLHFDDIVWTEATIAASSAVIMISDISPRLVAFIDFGEEITSDAGTFSVTFDPAGVLSLAEAV